jgi:hypothetical protein
VLDNSFVSKIFSLRYVHANEDKNKQKIKQAKTMKERKKKKI